MRSGIVRRRAGALAVVAVAVLAVLAIPAFAQEKPKVELYGFAMLDMGYDFKQTDPDWFDVVRPTKLPEYKDQWGKDGNTYAGVRQSRLGVKGYFPTALGELKTIFEFEMFGVGADAGQTTIRLRHAWGELGHWGAGQSWSPFMDIDVFPNSIEYWGPSGMVFFRNVQIRWMPMQGEDELFVALERPGASGDAGNYSDIIEPGRVKGRYPLPDLSAHYRMTRKWGHVQAAGILREIKWDDMDPGVYDLSGDALGWGVNLSTNFKFSDDVLRASVVYGEGIENYMNDATVDVGITEDPTDPGEPLPILGIVAFLDHSWSSKLSTSIGYSMVDIDNSDGQSSSAFKKGQYALVNLLRTPVPGVMYGAEFQWGQRQNNSDGWTVDDYRLQVSFKYNFSMKFGG